MIDKIRSLVEIVKKVNFVLSKRQKIASVKSFIAILVSAVFELLGVTMIMPFVSAIMNADALMKNVYIKKVVTILNIEDANSLLLMFGILIILVYIIKNILLLLSRYIQNRYTHTIEKELSMTMLNSYMEQPYEFFVNTNSAELVRGLTTDVSALVNILTNIFNILAELVTMSFIIIFIFFTDWFTAVILALFAGSSILAIIWGCKNIMRITGEKYVDLSTKKTRIFYQLVGGIKDIYVMQRKKEFVDEYENASEEYKGIVLLNDFVKQIPERIIEVVVVGGIIAIVCIRIMQGDDASIYIPKLSALALACFRLLPSMNKLTTGMTQIIFFQPGLVNIYNNILNEKTNHTKDEKVKNDTIISFEKDIQVKNVMWKYLNGNRNILDGLNIEINKGESVAIIGKSGEGKTTLADVLLGLLKPQKGDVLVDNQSIFGNLKKWAKLIGYVPQSVYLLDDTIRSNVLFGEKEIDEDKIWNALEQAQLLEFVQSLPEGLDTIVGERGVKFSGGQRQRIAIARALYYDPQIVVFDEATSALDDGTEMAVMEAINSLQGTKTLIIIAHRLSTIRNCDKIYEVKNGRAILRKKEEVLL